MTAADIARIGLQARIALARVGLMLPLTGLLILLGTALWVWVGLHAGDRQRTLMLVDEQHRLHAAQAHSTAERGSPATQGLRSFYGQMGNRADTEQYLAVFFRLAEKKDEDADDETAVHLDQGEYRWQVDNNSKTYRYQMLFPVKAPYASIRRYCERVLKALPFASLDELSFKREAIDAEELEASLRFSLFLKDVPPDKDPEAALR